MTNRTYELFSINNEKVQNVIIEKLRCVICVCNCRFESDIPAALDSLIGNALANQLSGLGCTRESQVPTNISWGFGRKVEAGPKI